MKPSVPPAPAPRVTQRIFDALDRFLHIEAASGVVLLAAATAALLWANSAAPGHYHDFWHQAATLGFGGWSAKLSLHFVINEALMAVFFLVVGMEIRREIHEGALASLRLATLPLAAAAGGVVLPALLYVALLDDPALLEGWAVPTATDIAFAVGVLALLGRAIPGSARVFLLALAIIDDIAAVIIIAVFYSDGVALTGIGIALTGIGGVLGLQKAGLASAWVYALPGAVIWYGLLSSGLHPALAGVALGLLTPARPAPGSNLPPPVVRVERALHPWVAYGIMPLFALANAGVSLGGIDLSSGDARGVLLATALALIVGKPFGIVLGSWCAVRLGMCQLSPGMTWGHVVLVGTLAGIGFTMAIFIATLAFADPNLLAAAKAGVLLASAVAGVLGLGWGLVLLRQKPAAA